jgi:hypothetical protein
VLTVDELERLPAGARVIDRDDYVYLCRGHGLFLSEGGETVDADQIEAPQPHEPPDGKVFLTAQQLHRLPDGAWVTEGDVQWEHDEAGFWRESETGTHAVVDLAHIGVWVMDDDDLEDEGWDEDDG